MKTSHIIAGVATCFFMLFAAAVLSAVYVPASLVMASLGGVAIGHLTAWRRFEVHLDRLGLMVKQEKARVVDLKSRRVLYVDPTDDSDEPLFG